MNTSEQLFAALQQAGLDQETTQLILENKLVASALVSIAQSVCSGFKRTLLDNIAAPPGTSSVRPYAGRKIDIRAMPSAIAAIRARSKKVTQQAVAKELGCKPNTLIAMMRRHPEIRTIYRAALMGAT